MSKQHSKARQLMAPAVAIICNEAERMLTTGSHDAARDEQQAMREVGMAKPDVSPRHEGGSIPDADIAKLFKAVGTAVWKLERRMLNEGTKEPKEVRIIDNATDAEIGDFRKLWRHVEAIQDALTDIGVDVIDWTGHRYDEGMSLKVVTEEERVDLKKPEITETLVPTIRFRQQVQIQMGEVIVGRPAAPYD